MSLVFRSKPDWSYFWFFKRIQIFELQSAELIRINSMNWSQTLKRISPKSDVLPLKNIGLWFVNPIFEMVWILRIPVDLDPFWIPWIKKKEFKNNEWSSFFKGILDSYYNQFRFIKSIYGLHFTFPVKYFFNFGKSAWLQVDSFSEPSSPTDFPFQNFKRTVLWFLLPFYLPKAHALTVLKKRKPEQSGENQILIFQAIVPAGPPSEPILSDEYMDNQNLKPARHLWLSSSRWIWFSKTNQKFKLENLYVNDFRPQHLFIVSDVVKHLSDRYLYLKLSCQIVDESGFWSIPTEDSFKFRKPIWISDKSANFNENFLKK